jgi:Na+-driven multidrug efflux pump
VESRDRTILRLAVPALATLAVEPLYVDTAIVGHLGTVPLGGLLARLAVNATRVRGSRWTAVAGEVSVSPPLLLPGASGPTRGSQTN